VEEVRRFGSMDELSRTLASIVLRLQFDSFLFPAGEISPPGWE